MPEDANPRLVSPARGLSLRDLIFCIEGNQGLDFQAIANRLNVSESAVCRWNSGETKPKTENHRALITLHDSKICKHTRFVYLCDHNNLGEEVEVAYSDPPLQSLVSLSELQCVAHYASPSPIGPGRVGRVILTIEAELPPKIRSRSYVMLREGPPLFLVFHRPGDDPAAVRELGDHVLRSDRAPESLPIYRSTATILPKQRNK